MERSELDYWLAQDALSLREAILLLDDTNPKNLEPPYAEAFYKIEDMAIRSSRAGLLSTLSGSFLVRSTKVIEFEPIKTGSLTLRRRPKEVINSEVSDPDLDPLEFARWAKSKGFSHGDFYKECFSINSSKADSEAGALPVAVEQNTPPAPVVQTRPAYDPGTANHAAKVAEAARLEIENRKLPKSQRMTREDMVEKVLGKGHRSDGPRQIRELLKEARETGLLSQNDCPD